MLPKDDRRQSPPNCGRAKHSVPFGCPTFVLKDELQQRVPFHKWKSSARLGMYLGKSPLHARNISLILDIERGYVSPQFHCIHDRAFATVRNDRNTDHGKWKIRAGFLRRQTCADKRPEGYPQKLLIEREREDEPPKEPNHYWTEAPNKESPD